MEEIEMKKRSTVMIFLLVLSIFIETSPQILNVRKALADDYGNTEAVLPLEVLGTASNTSSGLSPAQIKAVYNLPSNGGNGTVAIVDSYDDPCNTE
jgi:subtilase family serine protease